MVALPHLVIHSSSVPPKVKYSNSNRAEAEIVPPKDGPFEKMMKATPMNLHFQPLEENDRPDEPNDKKEVSKDHPNEQERSEDLNKKSPRLAEGRGRSAAAQS